MFAIKHNVSVCTGSRLAPRLSSGQWVYNLGRLASRGPFLRRLSTTNWRTAKRVSKKSLSDLTQGTIHGEPLRPTDKVDLRQETLTQVVRNFMTKFPDCVLLTKVGNFYELYFEHADEYAPKLGLRLAAKGKDGISMAGFPCVQLDKYLKLLVLDLDERVAICEEFPEYVGGKLQTPIPRRVARVVTAATLIDENFIDQNKNNFLLSIFHSGTASQTSPQNNAKENAQNAEPFGLAWIDVSTGEFFLQSTSQADLSSELLRIGATEVVLSNGVAPNIRQEISATLGISAERLAVPVTALNVSDSNRWIQRLDQPLLEDKTIASEEMLASQQLFDYIDKHLLETTVKPMRPQRREQHSTMAIDRSSIKGLELLKTARTLGDKGSLLNTIKRTVTQGGTRLLRERLVYPSIVPDTIEYRHDLLSAFLTAQDLHQSIVAHLRKLYDMHRIAQKFALGRGDAEDLLCLANTFAKMRDMVRLLEPRAQGNTAKAKALNRLLSQLELTGPAYMCTEIEASIDSDAVVAWLTHAEELLQQEAEVAEHDGGESNGNGTPDTARKLGGLSTVGVKAQKGDPWVMQRRASAELEALHTRFAQLCQEKHALQDKLRLELSAPKLILRFDSKYGHICQSPKTKGFDDSALSSLGANSLGHLKTVKSFYLPQWTSLGRQLDSVEFEIRQEEQKIFDRLRQLVVDNLVPLRQNASVMDELDVATAFATLAADEGWTRPVITTKREHKIVGGRHPTVKLGLQEQGRTFISNDLYLDSQVRAWLITGPNMAGKSTFLRQNALITILAQIGSYVPAEHAEIGIVDKIFSRIGAADDLFRNESTFMVEMLETATILRDATDRSFVIMDEVGRGTAPEDGAAVAYASLHHLYNVNQCRTLFATHFHGLADKTAQWQHLAQHCTDIDVDDNGNWYFAHKLRRGVNRRSHALDVAELAGLPASALEVARKMLAEGKKPPVRPVPLPNDGWEV